MKILQRMCLIAAVPVLALACTDLGSIENQLNSLDSRVSALEKQMEHINANINALSALAGNQTINKVEQDGDTYKLTLGNGTEISLYQGSIGIGNTPVLSIDADGYWQVDYGSGPEPVLQGGRKVYALGSDGVTPRFGVDEDNYWIVSYDDGATWTNVVYSSGENQGGKVKAYDAGSSDSYFHNVEYNAAGGVFVLTMKSGQTFSIPVVSDFLCSIEDTEDVQKFDYGQTRTFTVVMKGVSDYTILVPDGWLASLQGEGEAILAVTAPATATKSVYADSGSDVSIIAFTSSGLSTSAKMQVALTGQVYSHQPYTSPSKIKVGANEAQVRVLVENADEWYYLVSTSNVAPHAVEIMADGVKGTDNIFTISGLKQQTTYYLYTAAFKGSAVGLVSSCFFKTGITEDRYQAYLDGEDIVIADMHFSKSMYGDPVLLTATQENDSQLINAVSSKGGVYFLDTPEGTSFCFKETAIKQETIIVGRYASDRARLVQSGEGRLRVGAGLAMSFVEYDTTPRMSASDRTAMWTVNEKNLSVPYLLFDSCTIRHSAGTTLIRAGYSGYTEVHVKVFRMVGCNVSITGATGFSSEHFYTTVGWDGISKIREIVYRDNIFYSPTDMRVHLHFPGANFDSSADYSGGEETIVDISGNTFFGVGSDWYTMRTYRCASITVKRNLLYQYAGATVNTFNMVDVYGGGPTPVYDVENNYPFRVGFRAVGGTSLTEFPAANAQAAALTNPLPNIDPDTWDFTPASGFEKYGAQR